MIDEELVMFLFNPILSTKNNVSKTKKICAFVLLVLFSVCFFACSNLYESTETVNLSFDLPHSRSDTNNDRILKVYLHDKNGIILQQRETVFSTETVNVEFSKVLVNSEIYVSVEIYDDNVLQYSGKSELTKIKPGKNVIKLTLIQYDDEILDDNPEGGTETPETGGNTGSESGGETGGDSGTTIDPENLNAEQAVEYINGLTTSWNYPVEVKGAIKADDLPNIANAINSNQYITGIQLDLSGTTGLEEVPQECFKECTKLTKIILPGASTTDTAYTGLKGIGYEAFSGCTGLENITFPASLESISVNAFYGCIALEYIYYYGTNTEWKTKFPTLPDGNSALSNAHFKQVSEE